MDNTTEIQCLQNKVKELENTIKSLIWKSYHYRMTEIYSYFNINGIRKTATKFDMPIIDVINFIIECDDNDYSITLAFDYTECHIELFGNIEDDADDA